MRGRYLAVLLMLIAFVSVPITVIGQAGRRARAHDGSRRVRRGATQICRESGTT